MHLVAVTQLTYWVLVALIVDRQKWPQSVIFIQDLSATLSVPVFAFFHFHPNRSKQTTALQGSAQGFSLTLLLHVCCGGICWSFGLIVQNALRRLGCDLALSKQMLID